MYHTTITALGIIINFNAVITCNIKVGYKHCKKKVHFILLEIYFYFYYYYYIFNYHDVSSIKIRDVVFIILLFTIKIH